jgi:hypothetical protein
MRNILDKILAFKKPTKQPIPKQSVATELLNNYQKNTQLSAKQKLDAIKKLLKVK